MTRSTRTGLPRATTRYRGLCLALVLAACAGSDATPSSPALPLFTLSEEPTLEIGVMEGDPEYLFQDVVSVLRLPSGDLAVSDAGALEVTVYGEDGTFVRRLGGRGEGPGEFRGLSRIYAGARGSILALDSWTGRISSFTADGAFSHQMDAADLTGDTLFSLDVWLHGRFWVDGALDASERSAVRATLDGIPSPPPGEHRVVRVARDGRLWVREIHYSTHYTYSAEMDSLSWERPEGITVDIVGADRRGWVGVFAHPALDFICGLGYGASVPPGWPPGAVVCGPPPPTPTDVAG